MIRPTFITTLLALLMLFFEYYGQKEYRNTSHRVTWYITGLPNGTSLRAAQWTFA